MVPRNVAIVQACRLRRIYGRRMGQHDQLLLIQLTGQRKALPVQLIGQRDAVPVKPTAHEHPAYLTLSDVEPGE